MNNAGPDNASIAAAIAQVALARQINIAVAESLTGGSISSELAAAEKSSQWYAGAVVSYETNIKYRVLGVPEGAPVITEEAVTQMARGVRELMGVDAAVAVSGAGGPEGQDGQPVGTVWMAVAVDELVLAREHHFDGSPDEILAQTATSALRLLLEALRD